MDINDKIWVAGHRGMVGSAIWRKLNDLGYRFIIGHRGTCSTSGTVTSLICS